MRLLNMLLRKVHFVIKNAFMQCNNELIYNGFLRHRR